MGIKTTKYVKKPLYVEAVRVTEENFDELVEWVQTTTQAEVMSDGPKRYIKIFVHSPKNAKQTKAYIGDWLLRTDLGIKIYTNRAFRSSFDQVMEESHVVTGEEDVEAPAEVEQPTTVHEWDDIDADRPPTEELEVVQPTEPGTFERPNMGEPEHGHDTIPPSAAPVEHVPATPQAIADEATRQHEARLQEETGNDGKLKHEPQDPTAGKRVLSEKEQKDMSHEEVRDLLRSGEVILEQDLAA